MVSGILYSYSCKKGIWLQNQNSLSLHQELAISQVTNMKMGANSTYMQSHNRYFFISYGKQLLLILQLLPARLLFVPFGNWAEIK